MRNPSNSRQFVWPWRYLGADHWLEWLLEKTQSSFRLLVIELCLCHALVWTLGFVSSWLANGSLTLSSTSKLVSIRRRCGVRFPYSNKNTKMRWENGQTLGFTPKKLKIKFFRDSAKSRSLLSPLSAPHYKEGLSTMIFFILEVVSKIFHHLRPLTYLIIGGNTHCHIHCNVIYYITV